MELWSVAYLHQHTNTDDALIEEPYEPPFELPNFKTANYGKLLRAIPMHTNEDVWEEEDAVERAQVRAEIPMGINRIISKFPF